MESHDAFVTREDVERVQEARLPQVATRALLALRPKQILEAQTLTDAIELAACAVAESGRDFADLTDGEKADILNRNYEHCARRNAAFLHSHGALN